MTDIEMCEALYNGGMGETVKLSGSKSDLLAVLRHFKEEKIPLNGGIALSPDGCKGTNIRKVNLCDAASVHKVFAPFASPVKEQIAKPILDCERNGIVGTNGWTMLVSRIPCGFPVADAAGSGFSARTDVPWWQVAGELSATDYELSCHERIADIRKGDVMHGYLQTVESAVRAYSYDDEEGYYHTIRLRVGKKFYDAVGVSKVVDALFKLGCSSVVMADIRDYFGNTLDVGPLCIFGVGGEVDAKGLVMPIRYADESTCAFIMPLNKTTAKDAA